MNKYTWLFFDLDETIFDFKSSANLALKDTFLVLGLEPSDDLYQRYESINEQVWSQLREGKISPQTLKSKRWEDFLEPFDIKVEPEEVNEHYLNAIATYTILVPYALDTLQLYAQKYKIAAVTNGLAHVQRKRIMRARIEDFFDVIIISEEIGCAKPQSAYFDKAFAFCDQPKREEVLMIGDNLQSDIKGGVQYGIDTCWYNPFERPNDSGLEPTYTIRHLQELDKIL